MLSVGSWARGKSEHVALWSEPGAGMEVAIHVACPKTLALHRP